MLLIIANDSCVSLNTALSGHMRAFKFTQLNNGSIEKEDGLPNQICFPCEIKLESFAHFRFACAQTDMALKRKIDKNFKFKKELPDIDENSNFSLHNLFETKSDESHDKSKQNR
ncbi:uncharacterized protein LOC143909294 isoform X2 [Arctopsyche grandis]|uniref:uncharacterized protein LOC143909294 isoform X2 n=1 Tax=Arctopsyche grandis TaxID=121162 RepID=UPI00406D9DC4